MNRQNHEKIKKLAALALLTAIVVVLQLVGSSFHIGPIPFSLVLVPIVIGAVLYGAGAGAFLGAVFGVIALSGGIGGTDWFTATLWNVSPFWTAVTCVAKGALAGCASALTYRLLRKRVTLGCIVSALVCPIVNTGVFALAMMTVLRAGLAACVSAISADVTNIITFLFVGIIGVNFFVELGVNAALSAAITRVVKAVRREK